MIEEKTAVPNWPAVYRLIDKDGKVWPAGMTFETARKAAAVAAILWPDQEQDPDRTGTGWDIEAITAPQRCGER